MRLEHEGPRPQENPSTRPGSLHDFSKLHASEQRYRRLVTSLNDIVYTVDAEGRFTYISHRVKSISGYRPSELLGRSFSDFIHPEDLPGLLQVWQWQQKGKTEPVECRVLVKNGEYRFFRVSGRPQFEDRQLAGVTGTLTDVSERHEAESALRESEKKYRALFEQSIDAISIVTPQGRVAEANASWFRLFGYSPGDIEWLSVRDTYAEPGDRDIFLRKIAEKGSLVDDELRLKKKDGTVMDCLCNIVARRDESGAIVSLQGIIRDITEQKRAEQALRESEERFRMVLARAPVVMAHVDRDLRYTWVHNPHPDFDPASLLGKRDDELDVNEGTMRLIQLKQQVIETGIRERAVVSFPVSEGKRTYDIAAEPLRDDSGTVMGATTVAFDITERTRAEEALRQSEEKYRALFEQSVVPIGLVSPEGRALEANPACCNMFGYPLAELQSFDMRDVYVEQDGRARFLKAIAAQDQVEDEVQFRRKDGTVFDCRRSVSVRRASDGSVIGFQNVFRDVTEQKRAEEALRESEDKYHQIFEQSIAPISLISPEGRVLESNQAWRELFGYSVEDLPELNVQDQYPDPAERARFLKTIGSKGRLVDEELRLKRKDGTLVDLLRSTSVRRKPNGDIIGFQNVFRDVTELKRTRDELFASREQLRRLALRIQEAREEERTTIAQELHDHFSQQLTALRLDLDSLTRSGPPEDDAALVRIRGIMQLVDRMSQEVRRLISEMRPGMLDDLGLCAAIEWQAGQFSDRTGVACGLMLTADDARLPATTSTALFRVLQELLSNVARHAGATNVDVSLSSNSDSVCLTVADNGRGITDEELGSSTSLGILGIRERIRACDGTADFHGEPGTGTTVTVTVPIQPAANGQ